MRIQQLFDRMKLSNGNVLGSWSIPPTYVYDIIREQCSDYIPWVLVRNVQHRGKVPSHRECSGNVPMLPGINLCVALVI